MSPELLNSLAIFVLAILVGFEVISKVPATLHTPLMSGANSIHGIVLVGAMLIAAEADNPVSYLLAFVAMVFGAMNVVGGYVVTDRMLQMFRKKPTAPKAGSEGASGASGRLVEERADVPGVDLHLRLPRLAGRGGLLRPRPAPDELAGHRPERQPAERERDDRSPSLATLVWLVIRPGGLSVTAWAIIVVGFAIGGGAGLYTARTVKMTAMPQLVSLFNAVGGGAAALVAIDDFIRLTERRGRPRSTRRSSSSSARSSARSRSPARSSPAASSRASSPASRSSSRAAGSSTFALAAIAVVGTVALILGAAGALTLSSSATLAILAVVVAAGLVFGITMVLPIGGADMPVVISLLNSFTGTAAAMAGFVIGNPVLIISGALVGASGGILTKLMADAMNRSVINIIAGGFGGGEGTDGGRRRGRRLGPRDLGRRRGDPAGLRPARDRRARATGWPSPRPSTRSASWPSCSRRAAST